MTIALEARNLVKEYPGVLAVNGLSFSVPEGICFGLLGPNGAGKTTTVEIIEGVTRPTSGEIYYYGEIAGERFRQEAGIQFQNTALQDHITVLETLQMFRALYRRQANIDDLIEQCSLGDLLDRDNRKLSGGQRQRLLLAVALVNRPRLVFLHLLLSSSDLLVLVLGVVAAHRPPLPHSQLLPNRLRRNRWNRLKFLLFNLLRLRRLCGRRDNGRGCCGSWKLWSCF